MLRKVQLKSDGENRKFISSLSSYVILHTYTYLCVHVLNLAQQHSFFYMVLYGYTVVKHPPFNKTRGGADIPTSVAYGLVCGMQILFRVICVLYKLIVSRYCHTGASAVPITGLWLFGAN